MRPPPHPLRAPGRGRAASGVPGLEEGGQLQLDPTPSVLGRTRPSCSGGAAELDPAWTPHVCLPRPAEPHPVAAYQPLRPCGSGQRTHPSPTTTHLMACMGAGPGGGGRGREPSCGEMPGAAAAADPNAERAAGDSRAPPSVWCEDSRVRAGGAGQGVSCGGGGAPASPWTPKAQAGGPHPGIRTCHGVAQVGRHRNGCTGAAETDVSQGHQPTLQPRNPRVYDPTTEVAFLVA